MPKQNFRKNRQNQSRRNRKELGRIAEKTLEMTSREAFRISRVNPQFHEVIFKRVKFVTVGGVRKVSPKSKVSVVPNEKYRELLNKLIEMSKGLSVKITNIEQDDTISSSSQKI